MFSQALVYKASKGFMSVCLESYALRRRFEIQKDNMLDDDKTCVDNDFFSSPIPDLLTEAMYNRREVRRPQFFITKYWFKQWHPQTAVGIPIYGLMNSGLGAEVPVACLLKFIRDCPNYLLENVGILEHLKHARAGNGNPWSGFVSWLFHEDKLVSIEKSVPFNGLFALLDGPETRLSSFFDNPLKHVFADQFYGASLVSRYPYPMLASTPISSLVKNITNKVEKHFWAFAPDGVQVGSFNTKHTSLGVATAWSSRIVDVADRMLWTCQNIEAPQKQYRTDLAPTFVSAFGEVRKFLKSYL